MKELQTLRVSDALAAKLKSAADYCGMDVSELCRRVARQLTRRGEAEIVTQKEKINLCYILRLSGVQLPDWVSPELFRAALATACDRAMAARKIEFVEVETVEW